VSTSVATALGRKLKPASALTTEPVVGTRETYSSGDCGPDGI
jgi:hypothetical protein